MSWKVFIDADTGIFAAMRKLDLVLLGLPGARLEPCLRAVEQQPAVRALRLRRAAALQPRADLPPRDSDVGP